MTPDEWRSLTSEERAHVWPYLSPKERAQFLDTSALNPSLIEYEGQRIEVTHFGPPAERERFQVGRSTGWRPVHLRLYNRRSHGGVPIHRDERWEDIRVIKRRL
jgi:hypothetical protein